MKYREKAEVLKNLFFRVNRSENRWKDPDDLERFLVGIGGRLKEDRRRRRGFLVSFIQRHGGRDLVVEVPIDLAEKSLALGSLP